MKKNQLYSIFIFVSVFLSLQAFAVNPNGTVRAKAAALHDEIHQVPGKHGWHSDKDSVRGKRAAEAGKALKKGGAAAAEAQRKASLLEKRKAAMRSTLRH